RPAERFRRWQATTLTAGESEFLDLDESEATARIEAGRALLETATGLKVAGFVAPAWLYGKATRPCLRAAGFAYAEDHWRVWSPGLDSTLVSGPIVSYATRTPARVASSIAWSRLATVLLRPAPVVRVALHPDDFTVAAIAREIDRTLRGLLSQRRPMRYGD